MGKKIKESFINKLKDLRMNRKLSRLDVGKLIGRSEDCIEGIETGERHLTIEEAARLANIYKITLDDIYIARIQKSEI